MVAGEIWPLPCMFDWPARMKIFTGLAWSSGTQSAAMASNNRDGRLVFMKSDDGVACRRRVGIESDLQPTRDYGVVTTTLMRAKSLSPTARDIGIFTSTTSKGEPGVGVMITPSTVFRRASNRPGRCRIPL